MERDFTVEKYENGTVIMTQKETKVLDEIDLLNLVKSLEHERDFLLQQAKAIKEDYKLVDRKISSLKEELEKIKKENKIESIEEEVFNLE